MRAVAIACLIATGLLACAGSDGGGDGLSDDAAEDGSDPGDGNTDDGNTDGTDPDAGDGDTGGTDLDAGNEDSDGGTDPDAGDGSGEDVCTGEVYDSCADTAGSTDCAEGLECHTFAQAGASVCVPACSASAPCPDQDGTAVRCNMMGRCRPDRPNDCTLP